MSVVALVLALAGMFLAGGICAFALGVLAWGFPWGSR